MRKDFKPRKRTKDYLDNIDYKDSVGQPYQDNDVKIGISEKSLKGLPKSSYSVEADPYQASLPTAQPYPILAKFNKVVGGSYAGGDNIDGGNVTQYPNSLLSSLLKVTDFIRCKIGLNYRFRPMRFKSKVNTDVVDTAYVGSALVDQNRQVIAEATSVLQSTTFTQMAIKDYIVETDLPMGSAVVTEETFSDSTTHYVYRDIVDVIYATLTFYQVTLQEVINVINCFNSWRLKQGTMIRSSWNRETPMLNALFSLFNKKSFLGLVESMCLALPGEYVDTEWVQQVNMINTMPSRRSNSMFDPVLELNARHVYPHMFNLYVKDGNGDIIETPVFSFDAYQNPEVDDFTMTSGGVTKNLFEACSELIDCFSAESTMIWARGNNGVPETDTARFNYAKYRVDIINACMVKFKTLFNDIRAVLDTLSRPGINTWVKGYRPSIIKDTDAPLFNNAIINDVIKTIMSGANEVKMDGDTKRWRYYSMWNMYFGIPEYDAKVGGVFLALSAKTLDITDDVDGNYKYLPIAFYHEGLTKVGATSAPTIIGCTRNGQEFVIERNSYNIQSTAPLARLAPLSSQSGLELRVPTITLAVGQSIDAPTRSLLMKTLTEIFGVARDELGNFNIDPDLLAVYQIEIKDIINESINYARNTAVFKGTAKTEDDPIGFAKFGTI